MQAVQKVKDMVSTATEKIKKHKTKAKEKAAKAAARTKEEKEIAHEQSKAKQSQAKMQLHQEKADHRAETAARRRYHHHLPFFGFCKQAGITSTAAGPTIPTYPASAARTTTGQPHS